MAKKRTAEQIAFAAYCMSLTTAQLKAAYQRARASGNEVDATTAAVKLAGRGVHVGDLYRGIK